MQSNHEIIVPNENLPFKMFLFEKGNCRQAGSYGICEGRYRSRR